MSHRPLLACGLLFAAIPGVPEAQVRQSAPDNLVIVQSAILQAPPASVYAALAEVGRWWNGEHTYSGDAANLDMKAEAGACFCERWQGGAVEHARVILAMPGRTLRLSGALGPLQGRAVNAVLTFQIKPVEGGTSLELSYVVNGSSASALEKLASPVDAVLADQFQRLARYIETGRPAPVAK